VIQLSAPSEQTVSTGIAIDKGQAIAVWQQTGNNQSHVWANRYVPASGWGAAQVIQANAAGHAGGPAISMNAGGRGMAVWCEDDNTVWTARFE
jgi:hypothetical protein